ncbi:MAG: hypothetical protein Q4E02_02940 [Lagierella massiliensis]|nr:hypothetical protein [Lagierella massiliensis]
MSFGISILNIGNVGVDPFTAFNISVGNLFGISLGNFQVISNLVMLFFIFIFDRQILGVGTVLSMILIGYGVEIFSLFLQPLSPYENFIIFKIFSLLFGTIIFSLGISFYISAGLGVAPYDGLTLLIEDISKVKYRPIRIFQDCSFTLIAFLLKGPVGIGTVVSAFLIGIFVDFWFKILKKFSI